MSNAVYASRPIPPRNRPSRADWGLAKAQGPEEARLAAERVKDESRDSGGRWTAGAAAPPRPSAQGSAGGAVARYVPPSLPPLTTMSLRKPFPVGTPPDVQQAAKAAHRALWANSLPATVTPAAAEQANRDADFSSRLRTNYNPWAPVRPDVPARPAGPVAMRWDAEVELPSGQVVPGRGWVPVGQPSALASMHERIRSGEPAPRAVQTASSLVARFGTGGAMPYPIPDFITPAQHTYVRNLARQEQGRGVGGFRVGPDGVIRGTGMRGEDVGIYPMADGTGMIQSTWSDARRPRPLSQHPGNEGWSAHLTNPAPPDPAIERNRIASLVRSQMRDIRSGLQGSATTPAVQPVPVTPVVPAVPAGVPSRPATADTGTGDDAPIGTPVASDLTSRPVPPATRSGYPSTRPETAQALVADFVGRGNLSWDGRDLLTSRQGWFLHRLAGTDHSRAEGGFVASQDRPFQIRGRLADGRMVSVERSHRGDRDSQDDPWAMTVQSHGSPTLGYRATYPTDPAEWLQIPERSRNRPLERTMMTPGQRDIQDATEAWTAAIDHAQDNDLPQPRKQDFIAAWLAAGGAAAGAYPSGETPAGPVPEAAVDYSIPPLARRNAAIAAREAALGITPRVAGPPDTQSVTPVVPVTPVSAPVATPALAAGELGGQWQSFRGDTAERDMHPDLITRLELAPHSTHAIVGRRDRTGLLHSEWFEGPDHRARAEAQSEVWARSLLASPSQPVDRDPAERAARAARAARMAADLDDGGADWRTTGGAGVRRAAAGLPTKEEDHQPELADRQAQAASPDVVAPAEATPAAVTAPPPRPSYFQAAPVAGQRLEAYDPNRRPPTALAPAATPREAQGRSQANGFWDAITTDPHTEASFADRVAEAERQLARTPDTIRGGHRDTRHMLTGFIARGRELIGRDDRLDRFRPQPMGTPEPAGPVVAVAPLTLASTATPAPAPAPAPAPVPVHPQHALIDAIRHVEDTVRQGREHVRLAPPAGDPGHAAHQQELLALRGAYRNAVAQARTVNPSFDPRDDSTWGVDPGLVKVVGPDFAKGRGRGVPRPSGNPGDKHDVSRESRDRAGKWTAGAGAGNAPSRGDNGDNGGDGVPPAPSSFLPRTRSLVQPGNTFSSGRIVSWSVPRQTGSDRSAEIGITEPPGKEWKPFSYGEQADYLGKVFGYSRDTDTLDWLTRKGIDHKIYLGLAGKWGTDVDDNVRIVLPESTPDHVVAGIMATMGTATFQEAIGAARHRSSLSNEQMSTDPLALGRMNNVTIPALPNRPGGQPRDWTIARVAERYPNLKEPFEIDASRKFLYFPNYDSWQMDDAQRAAWNTHLSITLVKSGVDPATLGYCQTDTDLITGNEEGRTYGDCIREWKHPGLQPAAGVRGQGLRPGDAQDVGPSGVVAPGNGAHVAPRHEPDAAPGQPVVSGQDLEGLRTATKDWLVARGYEFGEGWLGRDNVRCGLGASPAPPSAPTPPVPASSGASPGAVVTKAAGRLFRRGIRPPGGGAVFPIGTGTIDPAEVFPFAYEPPPAGRSGLAKADSASRSDAVRNEPRDRGGQWTRGRYGRGSGGEPTVPAAPAPTPWSWATPAPATSADSTEPPEGVTAEHHQALRAVRSASQAVRAHKAAASRRQASLKARYDNALAGMHAVHPGFDTRDRATWDAPDDATEASGRAHARAFGALRTALRAGRDHRAGAGNRLATLKGDYADAVDRMQEIHPPFRPEDRSTWGVRERTSRIEVPDRDRHRLATNLESIAMMHAGGHRSATNLFANELATVNPSDEALGTLARAMRETPHADRPALIGRMRTHLRDTYGIADGQGSSRLAKAIGAIRDGADPQQVAKAWASGWLHSGGARGGPGARDVTGEARDATGKWTAGGDEASGRPDAKDGPGERFRLSGSSNHALVHNHLITIRPEDGHVRFGNDPRSPFHDSHSDDFNAHTLAALGRLRTSFTGETPWVTRRVRGADPDAYGTVISHDYLARTRPQLPAGSFRDTDSASRTMPPSGRQTFPEARIGEAPPPDGTPDPTGLSAVNRLRRGDELTVGYESHPRRAALRHTMPPRVSLERSAPTAPVWMGGAPHTAYTIDHEAMARRLIAGQHAQAIRMASDAMRARHSLAVAGGFTKGVRTKPVTRGVAVAITRELLRRSLG